MKPETKLRELKPSDFDRLYKKRTLLSSVLMPSQANAYNICIQFARDWFLEKFPAKFFNNVHIEGKFAFDDYRKFSSTDDKIKRVNPLLAIIPNIQSDYNRNWIDSSPEIPAMLRRTKMEGRFFLNRDNDTQIQIMMRTIVVNFTYKVRVDTKAQELDMLEYIKLKHRAGFTETHNLDLDVHVPNSLITQLASDNGYQIDENGRVVEPTKFLEFLNSHSIVPFLYKLRCANGNKEFFIKIPNCCAHIKMEMPTIDDGERSGFNQTNFIVEFQTEVEMTAPYLFIYYSQKEHNYILNNKLTSADDMLSIMQAAKTEIPDKNEKGWDLYANTEYLLDDYKDGDEVTIDFQDFFKDSDMLQILEYTKKIAISPSVLFDMKIFSNAINIDYSMDWSTYKCKLKPVGKVLSLIIAFYIDKKYVNDALIELKKMNDSRI